MSSGIRIQADASGNMTVSEPGQPTDASKPARDAVAATEGKSTYKQGGVVTRYDAATGKITQSSPSKAVVEGGPVSQGFTVRSEVGPVALAMAKGSDIIQIPQLGVGKAGETSIDSAVMQGYIIPRANGQGYEVVDGMGAPAVNPIETAEAVAAAVEGTVTEQEATIPAESLPSISPIADSAHALIKKTAGDTLYSGLIQRYIVNGDPSDLIETLAQRTGQSPADMRQATDLVMSEYQNAAKSVAEASGVPAHAWDSFLAWASETQPDRAMDAMTAFVERNQYTQLAKLAKQYARTGQADTAYSDEAVLAANFGKGVSAFRDENGRVMLQIEGHGAMTLAAAHQRGLVRLRNNA